MEVEGGGMEKIDRLRSFADGRGRPPSIDGRLALRYFSQDECGIFRAKSHAVTYGVLDLSFAANVGNIVEVAFGIGNVEIDGGRNLAMFHCDQRSCQPCGAASALSMSNL